MINSAEQQLLRYCSGVFPDAGLRDNLDSLISGSIDWPAVVTLAQDNGVAPLLYYHLSPYEGRSHSETSILNETERANRMARPQAENARRRSRATSRTSWAENADSLLRSRSQLNRGFGMASIPTKSFSALRESYQQVKESNLLLYSELKKILICFKENNIAAVLLKGIDLARRVYPDIGLRPMTDIDILIKKQDLPTIEKILFSLDYLMHPGFRKVLDQPTSPYLNTVVCKKLSASFISLHFHWHILNHSFYPGYGYISDLDINSIWQEAQPVQIDDVETLTMAPHHLLCHLSMHHLRHYYSSLIHLTDIDAVLVSHKNVLDWQKVIDNAVAYNFDKPLFCSLSIVSRVLGTAIPENVLSDIRARRISSSEKKFIDSVVNGAPSETASFFVFLAMNKGIKKKILFLFRALFAHPQYRAQLQDIHGLSGFKYNIRRLTRIFKHIFRNFWSFLLSG